jgi:hypothetical protein
MLLCCLLTLVATIDQLPLVQPGLVNSSPPSPDRSQSQDDDDDEMLDLAGSTAGLRASRREDREPPAVRPPCNHLPRRFSVHSPDRAPLTAPRCEHDFRNGFGAPLRC